MAPNSPTSSTKIAAIAGSPPNWRATSIAIGVVTDFPIKAAISSISAPMLTAIKLAVIIDITLPTPQAKAIIRQLARICGNCS
ncbi:Uncharacterised protein [Vibrio cholerae]|nr:Uncharacterised protein [Vibrio cholerae]